MVRTHSLLVSPRPRPRDSGAGAITRRETSELRVWISTTWVHYINCCIVLQYTANEGFGARGTFRHSLGSGATTSTTPVLHGDSLPLLTSLPELISKVFKKISTELDKRRGTSLLPWQWCCTNGAGARLLECNIYHRHYHSHYVITQQPGIRTLCSYGMLMYFVGLCGHFFYEQKVKVYIKKI